MKIDTIRINLVWCNAGSARLGALSQHDHLASGRAGGREDDHLFQTTVDVLCDAGVSSEDSVVDDRQHQHRLSRCEEEIGSRSLLCARAQAHA